METAEASDASAPLLESSKDEAEATAEFANTPDVTSMSPNDFTIIPRILDSTFEKYDKDGALKSTIIKTQGPWYRWRQENLLVKSQRKLLTEDDIASEMKQAMDLLAKEGC